jgi:hypothetical protein
MPAKTEDGIRNLSSGAVGMSRATSKRPAKKGRSAGGIVLGFVMMALFICELFVYTWCRVQYTQVGYEISRARKEQVRLKAVKKELTLELARLSSPERLAGIVETSMGLEMPSSRQMVVIE